MPSRESVAFFGIAGDTYSEIALAHLQGNFVNVQAFTGTTEVPPTTPDPGKLAVDWLFCFKTKTIFRAETLDGIGKAAINFHTASPSYPGSGGVNWALYNGDQMSAITVHRMTKAVDAGPIIEVFPFSCEGVDSVESLLDRTYRAHLLTFIRVTGHIADLGLSWVKAAEAAYSGPGWAGRTYRLRDLEALKRIDPDMPAVEIERRIRATRFRHYGPHIDLAGHRFTLKD